MFSLHPPAPKSWTMMTSTTRVWAAVNPPVFPVTGGAPANRGFPLREDALLRHHCPMSRNLISLKIQRRRGERTLASFSLFNSSHCYTLSGRHDECVGAEDADIHAFFPFLCEVMLYLPLSVHRHSFSRMPSESPSEDNPYDYRKILRKTSQRRRLITQP